MVIGTLDANTTATNNTAVGRNALGAKHNGTAVGFWLPLLNN